MVKCSKEGDQAENLPKQKPPETWGFLCVNNCERIYQLWRVSVSNPNPKLSNLVPFQKGYDPRRNGNGAPLKLIAKIKSVMESIAMETEEVTMADGKLWIITNIEAVIRVTFQMAKNGDLGAIREILARLEPQEQNVNIRSEVLEMTKEEAIEVLKDTGTIKKIGGNNGRQSNEEKGGADNKESKGSGNTPKEKKAGSGSTNRRKKSGSTQKGKKESSGKPPRVPKNKGKG